MLNQSSLNDVFRFVELKQANILSTFPIIETKEILQVKNESLDTKKQKANGVLRDLDFSIEILKHGRLVIKLIKDLFDVSSKTNNIEKVNKVCDFYEKAIENHIEVDSDSFVGDLELLSNLIYFTQYSSDPYLDKEFRMLYIGYQIISKAAANIPFRDKIFDHFFDSTGGPLIKNVGKAKLLVVKQHLLRYEETEIAHIENVMKGETRSREDRHLDRFEETLTYESESSKESEVETEISERFEMNRETSKTIEEDQKFSADLSISGKLGPTVNFDSSVAYEYGVSESSEIKSASEYAKDIMDRSLEKVNERVREERITKIIKENETKNLHSFTNVQVEGASAEVQHISGIYQFVDKIYKAQVFDYGLRQMFDLMIPEPASYLWHLSEKRGENFDFQLDPPPKIEINPFDIEITARKFRIAGRPDAINPLHYSNLTTTYGARGIKPPPTKKIITFSYEQPKAAESSGGVRTLAEEGGSGGWQFYPPTILDISIPQKYWPKKADIHIQAFTDNDNERWLNFYFDFGANLERFYESRNNPNPTTAVASKNFEYIMGGNNNRHLFSCSDEIEFEDDDMKKLLDDENKLKISYFSQDSANHTISLSIDCEPSEELIKEWQIETYDILQEAYQNRLLEFESKLAQFNSEKKAQENFKQKSYGVPPSKQKQVMLTEFKKHAISIFTDNHTTKEEYTSNSPLEYSELSPPKINREKAKEQGDFIRFFEHAFEWSQIQYALYPYFWSDQNQWDNKFKKDDPNYEYQQFLQAGAARLVVPVRQGFEEAVGHYLHTGTIWNGLGTPQIDDPLYLSIVDEIKERSGQSDKSPIPEGKPWEVRLPTSLIKLKSDDQLPKWRIKEGTEWDWEIGEEL